MSETARYGAEILVGRDATEEDRARQAQGGVALVHFARVTYEAAIRCCQRCRGLQHDAYLKGLEMNRSRNKPKDA